MSNAKNDTNPNQETLLCKIQSLEKRLGKIESILRIEWQGETEKLKSETELEEGFTAEGAESEIVEYGLAWLGSIVFLLGIVFLMSYTESLGYLILSKVVAYLFAILLLTFSYYTRKAFPVLANVINTCSPLFLYYITLKLHFFTEHPLILQKGIAITCLFILIGVQFYNAIRKNAEFQGVIAILLCITTAIFSDSTHITFFILITVAIGAHILFNHKLWCRLYVFSLFMVYLTHLVWLFSNPIMGHQMRLHESPQYSILFLFGYAIIYSLSIFISKEKLESNTVLISIFIWNALCFSIILLITILSFYKEGYVLIINAIALYGLLFAIILKLKSNRDFAPAMYACFGFMAFSIAIYGYFGLPNAYFLLVLQSFIVVSMALWFRSKIIVVANSLLFVSILFIYIIASESIDIINFTFAFTALATARILNWQKERLTLKTDIFRYIYLLIAFFMILFSLNQALPSYYVTLAWTATALGFFLLSILLNNIKYRYLSILTILVTGGHLFFIDLNQMGVGYRVIAFLVFAIISLGVSLYYSKQTRKK
ncbi:MAG: DUF2339 domain-containing protein [Cyclobacteriaceae bacterium]|nr:DUF2339 domain-containing protein [Cyclobacteriaceae bacterium]